MATRQVLREGQKRLECQVGLAKGLVTIARERTGSELVAPYPAGRQSIGTTTEAKATGSDLGFTSDTKFSQLKCPPTGQAEETQSTPVYTAEDSAGNFPSLFGL